MWCTELSLCSTRTLLYIYTPTSMYLICQTVAIQMKVLKCQTWRSTIIFCLSFAMLYSTSAVNVVCMPLLEARYSGNTMLWNVHCTCINSRTLWYHTCKPQRHEVEALASQLCWTIVPSSLVVASRECDQSWLPSSCLNNESDDFHRKPQRFSQQANHAISYERNIFSEITELKTFGFRFQGLSCRPWTEKTNSEDGRWVTDTHTHTQTKYWCMRQGLIMKA